MTDVTRIDALIQYTNKDGMDVTNPSNIVPINLLVYDEVNDLIKKGDGAHFFSDLPIWLDFSELNTLADIGEYINNNLFIDENIDKLMIIDKDGHISVTDSLTNTELIYILSQLPTIIATAGGSNITVPIIIGPIRKKINSTFELTALTFSAYNGEQEFLYEWVLPDDSVVYGNSINYTIADNINLIGTILTFQCKGISSEFGFKSKSSTHEVTIADTDGPVIISATYEGFGPGSSDYILSIDEQEL